MRRAGFFACILVLSLIFIGGWSVVSSGADYKAMPREELIKIIKSGKLPERADLSGINFFRADLSKGFLGRANLSKANLNESNLTSAYLGMANLTGAYLGIANLTSAILRGANLRDAELVEANLLDTQMGGVDLSGALLFRADLRGANLTRAALSAADFSQADLKGVNYQPILGSAPNIASVATARNLSLLEFSTSPHGLVELREGLKRAGLRRQEREVTYAIEHTKRLQAWKGGLGDKVESIFKLVLFEWTCDYGMSPGRALRILGVLIPVFAFPYIITLRIKGQDGIWKVWSEERMRKELGSSEPERITARTNAAILMGLYFSILSAFHIGWRDLNVGNWIARIQSREYTLRATGWVRTVSGIQSLISVYLLAMWALTYFGRPFG